MRRIEVTASTLGQANPSQVTASRPYRWHGIENWTGGNIPEVLEATPPPFTAGGAAIRNIRTGRIARFAEGLADLGHPDPETAPPLLLSLRRASGSASARRRPGSTGPCS